MDHNSEPIEALQFRTRPAAGSDVRRGAAPQSFECVHAQQCAARCSDSGTLGEAV